MSRAYWSRRAPIREWAWQSRACRRRQVTGTRPHVARLQNERVDQVEVALARAAQEVEVPGREQVAPRFPRAVLSQRIPEFTAEAWQKVRAYVGELQTNMQVD